MTLKRLESGEIYFGEPKWTAYDTIKCLVQLEETEEIVEFNATPYDVEEYGKELFEMLTKKYASQVAACTEEERFTAYDTDAKARRYSLLESSDWISNGDVMLVNQIEWLQYRQDLRDITLQEGYPYEIDWPQKPETTHSTPIDTRINSLKRQES